MKISLISISPSFSFIATSLSLSPSLFLKRERRPQYLSVLCTDNLYYITVENRSPLSKEKKATKWFSLIFLVLLVKKLKSREKITPHIHKAKKNGWTMTNTPWPISIHLWTSLRFSRSYCCDGEGGGTRKAAADSTLSLECWLIIWANGRSQQSSGQHYTSLDGVLFCTVTNAHFSRLNPVHLWVPITKEMHTPG